MRRSHPFLADQRGTAATELVLWSALLILPIASVVDLGIYAFQSMQVQAAAQAGAQAARAACRPYFPPFTANCAGLSSAVTSGVATTTIGGSVSVESGYPKEGFYCANGSNTLTLIGSTGTVAAPPSKPSPYTCNSVVSGSSGLPSDYLQVKVNFTYTPTLSSVSVGNLLPTTITRTTWIRLQ